MVIRAMAGRTETSGTGGQAVPSPSLGGGWTAVGSGDNFNSYRDIVDGDGKRLLCGKALGCSSYAMEDNNTDGRGGLICKTPFKSLNLSVDDIKNSPYRSKSFKQLASVMEVDICALASSSKLNTFTITNDRMRTYRVKYVNATATTPFASCELRDDTGKPFLFSKNCTNIYLSTRGFTCENYGTLIKPQLGPGIVGNFTEREIENVARRTVRNSATLTLSDFIAQSDCDHIVRSIKFFSPDSGDRGPAALFEAFQKRPPRFDDLNSRVVQAQK